MRGEIREAATHYFKAKQSRPDFEKAQVLEVLGHLILNDRKAFELAAALRDVYPASAQAISMFVQAAPVLVPLKDLEDAANAIPSPSAELLVGLAQAALERDAHAAAKAYAKQAIDADPSWIEAKLLWGAAVIQQHQGHMTARGEDARAELTAVQTVLTECIAAMRAESPALFVAHQCVNLAAATRMLGDDSAADALIAEAKSLAPGDTNVRLQQAYVHLRQKNLDAAISELSADVDVAPPRVQLVWAQMKAQRAIGLDRAEAKGLLAKHLTVSAAETPALRASWLETLIKLHLDFGELGEAERIIESAEGQQQLTPLFRNTFLAVIAKKRGQGHEAEQFAREAMNNAGPDADSDQLRDLTVIFEKLGDKAAALEVFKRTVDAQSDWEAIAHGVSLAWKVRDEEFILGLGQSLRGAGRLHLGMLEAEVSILLEASPARLEEFLKRLLIELPDGAEARYLRMRLTHLGIHLRRSDLMEREPTRLPRLDEVESHLFPAVVEALRRTEQPLHAVEFGYAAVRQFPNVLEAHVALITSVLGDPEHGVTIPTVDIAGPGTAVLLQEPGSSTEQWYVLEEADGLQPTMSEVTVDSAVGEAVNGQKVGDEVEIREAFGTNRKLVIQRLVHKYRYRFDDSFHNLSRRFPDQQFLKGFRVKEDAPLKEAFAEMSPMWEHVANREKEAVNMYRQHPFPLHMVAHMVGHSELATLSMLICDASVSIRCCFGTAEEGTRAAAAVSHAKAVVFEGHSLLLWFFLEAHFGIRVWDHVFQWPVNKLVPESVFDGLRLIHDDLMSGKMRLGGRRDGIDMVPAVTSGEALRASGERFGNLIESLKSRCSIVSGGSLNALPASRREILLKGFGRGSLASIVLAHSHNAVLWTDDLAVAELNRDTLRTERTWTQAALRQLAPTDVANRVTWGLLAFNYEFTSLSINEVVAAGDEAKWDINQAPLREVVDYLGRASPDADGVIRMAFALLAKAWTHPVLGLQARTLTFRLLDRIAQRDDGRRIIFLIDQHAESFFGINIVVAEQLRAIIRDWRTANPHRGLIFPPGR